MLSVRITTRLRIALVALASLALPGFAAAQGPTGTIEGTVTDVGTKRPLSGVQVSIVGTGGTVGALTNAQGAFRIMNVAVGPRTVRARLIGYAMSTKTADVQAGGTATVTFEMSQSAVELTAIVSTGTGGSQVESRKLGNTVALIEAPQNAPIKSFSDMLQGREAGVMALPSSGLTGEGTRIRIRGNASLSQSNEPIVYVDGVRMDNGGGFGNGFVGTGGGGNPSRLDDIDPSVIEKIEVLKGAAAATLYGTEASNGVILISTKRGTAGSPRWSFEADQSFKTYPTGRIEDQWGVPGTRCQASNAPFPVVASATQPALQVCADSVASRLSQHYGQTIGAFTPFSENVATNLFETGRVSTLSGQVSGGTPLVTYFAGLRGMVEDGPFTASNFNYHDRGVFSQDINNRYTGTLSIGLTPAQSLKVQSGVVYSNAYQEIPENNNSIYSPYTVGLFSKPENAECNASRAANLNVATNGSEGNGTCAGPGNPTGASTFGSMQELLQRSIKQNARHFNGHVRTSYLPTAELNLDATFGVDFTSQRSTAFLPFGNNLDLRTNQANAGDADLDDRTHQEITLSVNGAWNRNLSSSLASNLLFGAQGFVTKDNDESSTNQNFPGPGIQVVSGGSTPRVFESFSSIVNAGYFAQEQLGFRDWVFVTGGGRYDYNSAFGKSSGGVFYPQASISVIPSDRASYSASFLSKYLSSFRLRAAYGQAGRQPGAFDKLTTYTALTSTAGAGLVPQNLGDPDLTPEISTELEFGSEVGLRNDRISLGFTYWTRNTKDALYARQFPVTGGFRATQLANIGEMEANGWDARIKTFAVNKPDLSVDLYGSIGFLHQEVISLGGAPPAKVGGSYPRYRNFVIEGYAPGSFFSARLPSACPSDAVAGTVAGQMRLPKQPTSPASATTGGICLAAGQLPWDIMNASTGAATPDGIPDTEAQLLAYLANPRVLQQLNPIAADDDNDRDPLDHYDGKPLPDFEGSFGGSATIKRNWRIGTNFEYRFGDYTISDLTGAFRRASPANGGNTQRRAEMEAIVMNPASTPQQRLDAAKVYVNELAGLSPFDGMNQHFAGDFIRWRELAVTYTAPQRWASLAGAADMQITLSARNFMLWTKYPGVDPEVNLFGRRSGGGTDTNFAESIDAFGYPIPRAFGFNVRLGY